METVQSPATAKLPEYVEVPPPPLNEYVDNGFSMNTRLFGRHGTVGECCGSVVLTKGYKLVSNAFQDPFDPKVGFLVDKILAKRQEWLREVYGIHWATRFKISDTTKLIYVKDRTHEEVIEEMYSKEWREAHKVSGITIRDEDFGIVALTWTEL